MVNETNTVSALASPPKDRGNPLAGTGWSVLAGVGGPHAHQQDEEHQEQAIRAHVAVVVHHRCRLGPSPPPGITRDRHIEGEVTVRWEA